MELYLSLSAYGSVSTRQALTVFAEAGVQKVELAIGVKPDADATIAIQGFRQQGMQFRAHHAFVWESRHRPFNLAAPLKMDDFERMADWLAEQEITAYSVHPGHYGIMRTIPVSGGFLLGRGFANANLRRHGNCF